jgi:hypothetical protein
MNLHKYLHSAQGTLQEGKLGRKEVLKRGTAFQQSPLADKLLRRQRFLFLSCLLWDIFSLWRIQLKERKKERSFIFSTAAYMSNRRLLK